MDQTFYTMKELAEILPIGRNSLYKLVHSEGFPAIYINRRILIPVEPFHEWVKKHAELQSHIQ